MTFDPKGLAKSPAFATAGGVLLGLGVFWLISGTIDNLIRPLFNFVIDNGVVALNRSNGVFLGCAGFLSACLICVVAVVIGGAMIKMSGKQ